METPRVGQHVRIEGRRNDIFVILRIDEERHLADLLRLGTVHKVESGISLASLRVVRDSGTQELGAARG